MWHIASRSDHSRWVQYDQGTMTGDDETIAAITEHAGKPVPLAPMSDSYKPAGAHDEVGLFLLARWALPGPHTITGLTPRPPAASPVNASVVY